MLLNLLLEGSTNTTPQQQEGGIGTIIIMIVLIVAIIGLFIWQSVSTKKRQKEAQDMVNSIKVGDRVKTIGGICGFIAEIRESDNTFVLKTGLDNNVCYVRFDKAAIYQTAPNNEEVKEEPKVEAVPEEVKEEPVVEKPKKTRKKSTKKVSEETPNE